MRIILPSLVALFVVSLLSLSHVHGLTVLSIDFGSESFKVALVKPGVPMEVVLNEQSQRSTPVAVAHRDGSVLTGDPAIAVTAKYPKNVFTHLQTLLGQSADSALVDIYRKRFPQHNLVANENGVLVFKINDESSYTVEELVAVLLESAKLQGEAYSGDTIRDVVITVPAFFTQSERKAMLNAARLVHLNVLQLLDENAAISLNYGVFRSSEFNETAQNILFYDMGAGSTTATVVSYYTDPNASPASISGKSKSKKGSTKKDSTAVPVADIIGVGYDRNLGGFEIDLIIRDHLLKNFRETKGSKTKVEIGSSPRAMAKLLKEATRVKEVLSANTETFAQVENVHEDIDFKLRVTRAELESMCAHLFERVGNPVQDALKDAKLSLDDIHHVVLVGGGSRVPKVQEVLMKAVNRRELGKNINADEAAALGAAYQAAALSKSFRVKPFEARTKVLFPIHVSFNRAVAATEQQGSEAEAGESAASTSTVRVSKTIFGRFSPYPSKKMMTFSRHTDDFEVDLHYDGIEEVLPAEAAALFSNRRNLTNIVIKGVREIADKNSGLISKGIKLHFEYDANGIVKASYAESVFEGQPEEVTEKSTLEEIGDTISNFFGAKDGKKQSEDEQPGEDQDDDAQSPENGQEQDDQQQQDQQQDQDEKHDEDKEAKESKDKAKEKDQQQEEQKSSSEESKEESKQEEKDGSDDSSKREDEKATEKKIDSAEGDKSEDSTKKKPKNTIIRELLTLSITPASNQPELDAESIAAITEKINEQRENEKSRQALEAARNELESLIYSVNGKFEDDEGVKAASTEEQREEVQRKVAEVSEWLFDASEGASLEEFKDKKREVSGPYQAILNRAKEHQERPAAIAKLKKTIQGGFKYIEAMRKLNETERGPTDEDLDDLFSSLNDTAVWLAESEAAQSLLAKYEDVALSVRQLVSKDMYLDRIASQIAGKPKPKPKSKPKPKTSSTKSTSSSNKKNAKSDDGEAVDDESEKVIPPQKSETGSRDDSANDGNDSSHEAGENDKNFDSKDKGEPGNYDSDEYDHIHLPEGDL